MEISNKELLFLDILIKRSNDKIMMNTYFNTTDSHQCLPSEPF